MNHKKHCVAIGALLMASLFANAQTVFLPNGDFQLGSPPATITDWDAGADGDGSQNFEFGYEEDAGPNGTGDSAAVIKDLAGSGSGFLLSNNNNVTTLASLGLSPGNVYKFSHDMKNDLMFNSGIGGFKVDFFSGNALVSSTDDIRPDVIGSGSTWETYEYDIAVPLGVDGLKVVLLWGVFSDTLFDNVKVNSTPIAAYAPSDIPNKNFETAAGDLWEQSDDLTGDFSFTFPASGGVSDSGYAQIEDLNNAGSFGILIANANNVMTLNGLGLTPGNSYTFSADMALLAGANIGGIKVDFFDGPLVAGADPTSSTGDLFPDTSPTAPSSFSTYDFTVDIPTSAVGIKVVLVGGTNSTVCFDNICFDPMALAPITEVPNKRFDDLGDEWSAESGSGAFSFEFPATGGSTDGGGANPGGHATIDDTDGAGFAVLVARDNNIIPTSGLNLIAGNTYEFTMDMKLISGSNVGGLKVEFFDGPTEILETEIFSDPIVPAGDWQTYTYQYTVPTGTDGIKVVPLWGASSKVAYDNVCFDDTPVTPPPTPPVELMNPDFEEPDGAGWQPFSAGTFIDFPATGGHLGGYCRMDHDGGVGSFGVIVSNDTVAIPLADLGLSAGTTITIQMDMLKESGSSSAMGNMKVEYLSGALGGFPNNEVVAPVPAAAAPDDTWATYTFDFAIPTTIDTGGAVDGIKIVPIAGIDSAICYDNIVIVVPTPDGEIVLTVDSFDTVNNMIMLNLEGVESGETYSIFSSSTLSGGVTNDTGVDVTDATSQPFAVSADEASSPGFFQAKQD